MSTPSSSTRQPAWDVILTDGSTARGPARFAGRHPRDNGAARPAVNKTPCVCATSGLTRTYPTPNYSALVEKEGSDHLALVAERAGQLVGVAQYDRIIGSAVAEVAFVVDDAHQGLGIGTLLLEYLASEGRRYGLKRFAADILFENARMVKVFQAAGFTQHSQLEDGVIRVVMDISPTTEALRPLYERDRKAAARSMQRLLRPRSVAVIGASRSPGTVGHELVRNLVTGGFQGPVYPVNPTAAHIASVPCFASIDQIPGDSRLGHRGGAGAVRYSRSSTSVAAKAWVAWLSSRRTSPRTGPTGQHWSARRSRLAHAYGMRVVGPNCFGVAQHRRRRLHERHLRQGHAYGGHARLRLPVGRPRDRHPGRGEEAGDRSLQFRLDGQQGRRQRQRPALAGGPRTTPPASVCCTSSRSATLGSSLAWPAN